MLAHSFFLTLSLEHPFLCISHILLDCKDAADLCAVWMRNSFIVFAYCLQRYQEEPYTLASTIQWFLTKEREILQMAELSNQVCIHTSHRRHHPLCYHKVSLSSSSSSSASLLHDCLYADSYFPHLLSLYSSFSLSTSPFLSPLSLCLCLPVSLCVSFSFSPSLSLSLSFSTSPFQVQSLQVQQENMETDNQRNMLKKLEDLRQRVQVCAWKREKGRERERESCFNVQSSPL